MDELELKELEELEELEKEALEERDNGQEEQGNMEETEGTVDDEQTDSDGEEDESEEQDDSRNSGDGHEDEPTDGEEEELEEEPELEEEVKSDFTPIEIEVSGHKVKIESQEDLMAYVKKGAESFNKKQETFVDEKNIVEQGKLTQEDLKLLVDAKNGSKEAIAKLAEIGKIDVLDLESEMASKYQSQFEPIVESEVDKVASEILSDEAHANDFKNITSNLPTDFINTISSNAEALRNFSGHIKSGLAQEVIPMAITAQMKHGGNFVDHYVSIGQKLSMSKQEQKPTRSMSQEEVDMRSRASKKHSKTPQGQKKVNSSDDVWDMSDAEFEEKYGA